MYKLQEEQRLLDLSKQLVKSDIHEQEAKQLREVIEYADWKYYVKADPIIADAEYDALFKKLKNFEAQHPELDHRGSPTTRVASGLNADFPSVEHLVPMLSLENSYNAADLLDWDRKCREQSADALLEYTVEPKFDGASISLVYEAD
ncbi:MAG TPA: DNA ligase (NAD(+)) LigA, partial [Chitinophagaceae bacterium]|nr:DNA ligase (NAD(+)) LigA [Chitinophagaceae bacterium]